MSEDTGPLSIEEAAAALAARPAPGQQEKPAEQEQAEATDAEEIEPEDTPEADPPEDEPEDESEDEESEDDIDGDETEQDEDPEDQTAALEAHTVKIDGEESQVTTDELVKGYQRQSDYTRKSQTLSEKAKKFDETAAVVAQELRQMHDNLSQMQPVEPNWETLFEEDPLEAPKLKFQWEKRQKTLDDAAILIKQRDQQAVEAARSNTVDVLRSLPQWSDESAFVSDMESVAKWAKSAGADKEDLQLADTKPFYVESLWKALQWDNLQKEKPIQQKKAKRKPKVTKPGVRQSETNKVRKSKKIAARAMKSGSVEDAVALLEQRRTG